MHLAAGPVQANQFAQTVAEMVTVRLRQIVQLVRARVDAAGRHRVQQRLPEMGPRPLHQRDLRRPPPPHGVAKPGDELQPGRSPTHDDDLRHISHGNLLGEHPSHQK